MLKNRPTITLDAVKEFFITYFEQKKQAHGTHNFVANGNKYEYQIDRFLFTHRKDPEYEARMVCINIFQSIAQSPK